ncbi:hypothetical protein DFH07DRAFT_783077 [Mycena maculata]|uniref:Uncharacterized protein n=1 Tax=Mycena maculata TaxID=230809 RepID=A0AAD7MN81_9AGAR|nr:hypothetical protein DFH07DRAFT_783077 [Mycena maculata]
MGKKGPAKPRERQRVPEEKRKNLRLWAEGARKQILKPHLDKYMQEFAAGWVRERAYLQEVCNEFHSQVDWRLADHEEPLPDNEEVLKRARMKLLNGCIWRWFKYCIRRRHARAAGLDPRKDPFAILLAKLSGLTAPPKARQAYQQFMVEDNLTKVAPVIKAKWEEARAKNNPDTVGRKEPKVGFRAKVARSVFAQLPEAERLEYGTRATAQAKEAKASYMEMLKGPPSNKPADRLKCIEALPDFIAPILAGIQEHTGLQSFVIFGGPMPEFGGEIKTVHVTVGTNKTTAESYFPVWDKKHFNEQILKFYTKYLTAAVFKTAVPEDCIAAAMPNEKDLDNAKYTMEAEDNVKDPELSEIEDDSDLESDDSDVPSDNDLVQPLKKKCKANTKKRKRSQLVEEGDKPSKPAEGEEDREESAQQSPPTVRGQLPDEEITQLQLEREANLRRNAALNAQWKAEIHKLVPPDPPSAPPPPPRPRARSNGNKRPTNTAPTRRSQRVAQAQTGGGGNGEDTGGEGIDKAGGGMGIEADGGDMVVDAVSRPGSSMSSHQDEASRPASSMSSYPESGAPSPPGSELEENPMDVDDLIHTRRRPDFFDDDDDHTSEPDMSDGFVPNPNDLHDLFHSVLSPPADPPEDTPPCSLRSMGLRTSLAEAARYVPSPSQPTSTPGTTNTLPATDILPVVTYAPAPPTTNTTTPPFTNAPTPPTNAVRAVTTEPEPPITNAPAPAVTNALPPIDTAVPATEIPPGTNTPPYASTTVVCPLRAPDWFCHVLGEMTKRDLGPHFNAVLAAWIRIEAGCDFESHLSQGVLSSKGRPEHIGRWIQAARGRRNQLNWLSKIQKNMRGTGGVGGGGLQPEWRTKDSEGTWVIGGDYGKEWDMLSFWGISGTLSVVVSVYFWGCSVQGDSAELEELEVCCKQRGLDI